MTVWTSGHEESHELGRVEKTHRIREVTKPQLPVHPPSEMDNTRGVQDPCETSPLLRSDEYTVGHSSSSSSNGSTTVGDSPSVAATELPDAASAAPSFGPVFGSLAVDSFPGQSPSSSSSCTMAHTLTTILQLSCPMSYRILSRPSRYSLQVVSGPKSCQRPHLRSCWPW